MHTTSGIGTIVGAACASDAGAGAGGTTMGVVVSGRTVVDDAGAFIAPAVVIVVVVGAVAVAPSEPQAARVAARTKAPTAATSRR